MCWNNAMCGYRRKGVWVRRFGVYVDCPSPSTKSYCGCHLATLDPHHRPPTHSAARTTSLMSTSHHPVKSSKRLKSLCPWRTNTTVCACPGNGGIFPPFTPRPRLMRLLPFASPSLLPPLSADVEEAPATEEHSRRYWWCRRRPRGRGPVEWAEEELEALVLLLLGLLRMGQKKAARVA